MTQKKYQIFISSTYTDLVEEREGIIKAILELFHIPIGMEMFSAEDEEQWEIIRRTIEISDYYILILGLRYGSKTKEGISFTQKEYNYALEKNIPVLAFILNDNVSLTKVKRDDDLTDITKFREEVLNNKKMSQFWNTKEELAKNVILSLTKQMSQKPRTGWIRGDQVPSEKLAEELALISEENRRLRSEVDELKKLVSMKKPKFIIRCSNIKIDNLFESWNCLPMPKKINFDKISADLKPFCTEDEISEYNSQIPSQKEIDEYNSANELYYKYKNYANPILIEITNEGNIKAKNIYIDLFFPKELLIICEDQIIETPINPIQMSPIEKARQKLENSKIDKFQSIKKMSSLGTKIVAMPELYIPKRNFLNLNRWGTLSENKLTIRIKELLHTRMNTYDDQYKIIPLKAGVFNIKAHVICEEFEIEEIHNIVINVD